MRQVLFGTSGVGPVDASLAERPSRPGERGAAWRAGPGRAGGLRRQRGTDSATSGVTPAVRPPRQLTRQGIPERFSAAVPPRSTQNCLLIQNLFGCSCRSRVEASECSPSPGRRVTGRVAGATRGPPAIPPSVRFDPEGRGQRGGLKSSSAPKSSSSTCPRGSATCFH